MVCACSVKVLELAMELFFCIETTIDREGTATFSLWEGNKTTHTDTNCTSRATVLIRRSGMVSTGCRSGNGGVSPDQTSKRSIEPRLEVSFKEGIGTLQNALNIITVIIVVALRQQTVDAVPM